MTKETAEIIKGILKNIEYSRGNKELHEQFIGSLLAFIDGYVSSILDSKETKDN
jgi:hypothetical protein